MAIIGEKRKKISANTSASSAKTSKHSSQLVKKINEFCSLYAKQLIVIMFSLNGKPPSASSLLEKLFPDILFKKMIGPQKISPSHDQSSPLIAYFELYEVDERKKLKQLLTIPIETLSMYEVSKLKEELEDFKEELNELIEENYEIQSELV